MREPAKPGAEARRGPPGTGTAEQHARAGAPRARQEPRRDHAFRPRQETEEDKAEYDENETGDLELALGVQRAADRGGRRAEQHEHDREAEDERQARDDDASCGARLAEAARVDRGYRGEVARDQRQHAWRDDRQEPCEKRDWAFF